MAASPYGISVCTLNLEPYLNPKRFAGTGYLTALVRCLSPPYLADSGITSDAKKVVAACILEADTDGDGLIDLAWGFVENKHSTPDRNMTYLQGGCSLRLLILQIH